MIFATALTLMVCFSTVFALGTKVSSSQTKSIYSSTPLFVQFKQCNGTTNGIVNNIAAILYSNNYVYTYSSQIPDYAIGPWFKNPMNATDQKRIFQFPRYPKMNPKPTALNPGHIGQLINGVSVYKLGDGNSYNNMGIWNQNAGFFELSGFDSCYGHPASTGEYHVHIYPKCLFPNLNSTSHSPIFGFAFDGFPIYGPYAYSSANNSNSGITRMRSSFQLRSITNRTTLANGTTLASTQYGPAITINGSYDLGAYSEDYEFISGSGDLDQNNGRYGVTPEYPNGTYAYFATIDANGKPQYPYFLGLYYYGVFANANLFSATINETVSTYFNCSDRSTTTTTTKSSGQRSEFIGCFYIMTLLITYLFA